MKRKNSAGQMLTLAAVCTMLGAVPLAIVPFPFLFPQAIYEYSLWPKAIVLHLCIALGVVGWMIQSRWGTEAGFVHNRLTLPLVCFLGIAAAASLSTPHPIDSLFELFNLAALIVLYLVVSNMLSSSGLRSVLWANVIAGLLVSFVGILQYQDIVFLNIPSNGPPSATFGYRNFAAMYLICALPLSVLMFLMVSRLPALLVSGLSASLMGVFLVYTRTRGAWLGIAIGLMAVSMVALHLRDAKPGAFRLHRLLLGVGWSFAALGGYIWGGIPLLWVLIAAVPGWVIIAETLSHIAEGNRRYHFWLYLFLTSITGGFGGILCVWAQIAMKEFSEARKWISLMCVGVFLALSFLPARFNDLGLQRFDEKKANVMSAVTSAFTDQGDRGRKAMWMNTLDLIADNPILGVGAGGWKRAYPPYDRRAMIRLDSMPRRPHNDYLWIASEYGVPALVVYTWLLVVAFRQLYVLAMKRESGWQIVAPFLAMSLIATVVHAGFSFPRERPQAALYPFLIFGLIASAGSRDRKRFSFRFLGTIILATLLACVLAAGELTRRWISFDTHYLQALMAEDESDWETVTSEVNLARHSGVFRPHLLVVKGRAEEKNQDYASAESSYRQVLDLSPHNWHALNGLGVVLKRQGRFDEAKEHYQAALAIFPGASVVWNNLGALYKSMGDSGRGNSGLTDESRKFYQMAETEYRKVLGHVPRDAGANNNLGNLYKARMQPDSAAAYYELALESNPELAQAHNNLADLYRQKRQYQKAISHYKTAADLIHTEPRIFWGLAQSLEAAGDVTGALEAYKTTISLKEDFAQVHFSMGNLLYDLGRFEQALQHFRRFIELWSGDRKFVDYAKRQIKAYEDRIEK